ncbi:hypothetical protein [Streptomyces sp. JJ36]|uniref:hypothetical protein n=1 Tax=Streptomyces sp. JJ36 TaxID=2736645 RepID=UPI001F34531A|nr:hypothetical protein [Streptomyces sp. JJ36]MCF6522983.1 hypothetical protein [Streptomyces sp. JJ36]
MAEREGGPGQGDEHEPTLPADEEAAWAQIVAAYEDEPDTGGPEARDAGARGSAAGDAEDAHGGTDGAPGRAGGAHGPADGPRRTGDGPDDAGDVPERDDDPPVRSFTVYTPGAGPRDWSPPEGAEREDDEGHFVPPEPPPLPEADTVTKFAWVAALGGPLLLIGAVLFRVPMTWWIVTLGVGGFLGGFATLVARMRDGRDDDDFDDPGRGAVV